MIVYVDGGYNNKEHKDGYGSFAVYNDANEQLDLIRFNLPEVNSSNEAEYVSLMRLLTWLEVNDCLKTEDHIMIYTDSRLMVNQLSGEWHIKADNLRELATQVQIPEKVTLGWITRKVIVKILGH